MALIAFSVDQEARCLMTRPLRRAHFYIWVLLSLVLVLLVSASLVERRSTTPVNSGLQLEHRH
jgi:hypothetical protein